MMKTKMPLIDKKIIITRAQEQSSEAHKIFKHNGAQVFDLPSLIIGPPDDWSPLDDALKDLNTFHWIIWGFQCFNEIDGQTQFLLNPAFYLYNKIN